MAQGGARARSGPPPDPNALRRERDSGEWVTLPAEGRQGAAPAWPLPRANAREKRMWAAIWQKPQAVMWERNGQVDEVALYVRRFCEVEVKDAPASATTIVRQMMEGLGISVPGLLRNRWRIAPKAGDAPAAPVLPMGTSRSRLRVAKPADDAADTDD